MYQASNLTTGTFLLQYKENSDQDAPTSSPGKSGAEESSPVTFNSAFPPNYIPRFHDGEDEEVPLALVLKAKRKRATAEQVQVLNRVFETTSFPSTEMRKELAKQLNMTPRTVQIWFQNKRQALRMRGRDPTNRIQALPLRGRPSAFTRPTACTADPSATVPLPAYVGPLPLGNNNSNGSTPSVTVHSPFALGESALNATNVVSESTPVALVPSSTASPSNALFSTPLGSTQSQSFVAPSALLQRRRLSQEKYSTMGNMFLTLPSTTTSFTSPATFSAPLPQSRPHHHQNSHSAQTTPTLSPLSVPSHIWPSSGFVSPGIPTQLDKWVTNSSLVTPPATPADLLRTSYVLKSTVDPGYPTSQSNGSLDDSLTSYVGSGSTTSETSHPAAIWLDYHQRHPHYHHQQFTGYLSHPSPPTNTLHPYPATSPCFF
ncbi:hypothetical protein IWQ62_003002 [Dispira parvispora]|uniref:Homeobox domain-containing protein n=1 Tax=Dispira parvispora TaxID=1520584 RepID=A0A9W8E6N6_9FUNG|nr:hypothetical protein IWQ62_003002 [Dispira parvispora]